MTRPAASVVGALSNSFSADSGRQLNSMLDLPTSDFRESIIQSRNFWEYGNRKKDELGAACAYEHCWRSKLGSPLEPNQLSR
jgi:hypothetical protein